MKKGLSSWDRLDRKRPALTIVKARQDRVNNTAVNNDTGNHLNCEESWEAFNIICNATVHNCFPNSVYSRAWPSGISAMWKKKCLIKFTLPGQIVRKKKDSSIKYYFFWKKVFENITDNNTDLTSALWLTLNFYSLLLSQLPFSYSFKSLFHQTNIRDSAVIPAQTFSVSYYVLIFFFRFSAKQSSSSKNPLILEKGPPKITEGGQHGW